MEQNFTPKSEKRLKIVINVNISEKNTQQLKIFEDESIDEAVYNFCNVFAKISILVIFT
jgi:hypothetical protein